MTKAWNLLLAAATSLRDAWMALRSWGRKHPYAVVFLLCGPLLASAIWYMGTLGVEAADDAFWLIVAMAVATILVVIIHHFLQRRPTPNLRMPDGANPELY